MISATSELRPQDSMSSAARVEAIRHLSSTAKVEAIRHLISAAEKADLDGIKAATDAAREALAAIERDALDLRIGRIELAATDILVIKLPKPHTPQVVETIQRMMREHLVQTRKCIVLEPGMKLSVLAPSTAELVQSREGLGSQQSASPKA